MWPSQRRNGKPYVSNADGADAAVWNGTDALTGLPNRRDMIETIDRFRQEHSGQIFSVAIADIDFFKKIKTCLLI